MLDRLKFARELSTQAPTIFTDAREELALVERVWNKLAADPVFAAQVRDAASMWSTPRWADDSVLTHTVAIERYTAPYNLIAVDGSQVYPDRHQGTSSYMINVGLVQFSYVGIENSGKNLGESLGESSVKFESIPFIFSGHDELGNEVSPEAVNCQRTAYELAHAAHALRDFRKAEDPGYETNPSVLFDGALIFWHLDAKEKEERLELVQQYCASLEQFYTAGCAYAGYISLPKSRELVNLVRVACTLDTNKPVGAAQEIRYTVDTDIVALFLQPGSRTITFASTFPLTLDYPEHLRPHFFYLHVGHENAGVEIARVEIPAYVARSAEQVDRVAAIIMDQVCKGRHYPVCLAEAHEQAVIKAADREFFYAMIRSRAHELKRVAGPTLEEPALQSPKESFKSMNKRIMRV